ncbi:MAG: peptide deformylase [Ekhidna sp.]|nr:peptide deformylase [Ekhidna sp.]
MDILKVGKAGSEALHTICKEVPVGANKDSVMAEMFSAMKRSRGVGIAAPQVGHTERIIYVNTSGFMGWIFNPVITKFSGRMKLSKEGCLSVPNVQVKIKRDAQIVVEGFDENWVPIKKKLKQHDAFVVQHELDHLDSITILDYNRKGLLKDASERKVNKLLD